MAEQKPIEAVILGYGIETNEIYQLASELTKYSSVVSQSSAKNNTVSKGIFSARSYRPLLNPWQVTIYLVSDSTDGLEATLEELFASEIGVPEIMESSAFELADYNLIFDGPLSWTLPDLNLTLPILNTPKGINVLEKVLGQYNKRIESTNELTERSPGYRSMEAMEYRLIKDIEPEKSAITVCTIKRK